MSNLTISTNHHWRSFLYRDEVPEKILQNDFDWLDADTINGFIKYKGEYYHTSQFMRFNYAGGRDNEYGYDGYLGEGFFSALWIKISEDGEAYQIARAMS